MMHTQCLYRQAVAQQESAQGSKRGYCAACLCSSHDRPSMHTSKLFVFCDKLLPGSLSRCIWLACSVMLLTVEESQVCCVICFKPPPDHEQANSSKTECPSLNQTIVHIAAAIQAALEGQDLPCILLAQHQPESILVLLLFLLWSPLLFYCCC